MEKVYKMMEIWFEEKWIIKEKELHFLRGLRFADLLTVNSSNL